MEKQSVLTDVKVHYFLVLISFTDDLCREVDCLINLNSDLGLNTHLAWLIAAPTVKFTIAQQSDWITFTRFCLLDCYLLLIFQILEVFIWSWDTVIFVLSITKNSVLTITPVVNNTLAVNYCSELSSCCDSLNFFSLQCTNLNWLGTSNVSSMTQRTSGVHKEVHYHSSIFATITKWIDFTILWQANSVFLSTNSILNLDVVFIKIFHQKWLFYFVFMTMTALSMLIISEWINFTWLKLYLTQYR